VISNSWGGGESSGETSSDSTFAVHGVTFVFSAGDSGTQEYPAESPNVVAVGGTTLSYNSLYNWTGESGWNNSYGSGGGGVSAYEAQPSYQSSLTHYGKRADPDIAYDADPVSGFAVYDSYGAYFFNPAWGQYGGTSAGAPQISALIALANQGRGPTSSGGNGLGTLDGVSQTLPAIYSMTTSTSSDTSSTFTADLFDVTSGSTGAGSAVPGYDLVTGQGTPRNALNTYNALVNAS
jgi:subtilase family serine protease